MTIDACFVADEADARRGAEEAQFDERAVERILAERAGAVP